MIRLAGNDTHLLGISREVEHAATVAAAGVGRGRRGARVPPARGLPRDPVHRGHADGGLGRPPARRASRASPTRCAASTTARRSRACSSRSGSCEAYRALAEARGVPMPPRVRAGPGDRRAGSSSRCSRTRSSCGRATTTSCRATSSTTGRGSGSSTGSTPGWATRSSTSATSAINNDLTPDEDAAFLAAYDGGVAPRADRLARLTLMRVGVRLPRGDVGRAPAGDQHARRRLPRVRRRALRPAARQRGDAAASSAPSARSAGD